MPTVTLRPNANGDVIQFGYVTDSTHWGACRDQYDGTYVWDTVNNSGRLDLFQLDDFSLPSGAVVTSVTVYIRCRTTSNYYTQARTAMRTAYTTVYGNWNEMPTTEWLQFSTTYGATNPVTGQPWTQSDITNLQAGGELVTTSTNVTIRLSEVWVVIEYVIVSAPTVSTGDASNIAETTATGNGSITDTGGQNCDLRGFEWGTTSGNYPNSVTEGQSGNYQYGTGAYSLSLTSLPAGTLIYYRAKAHNSAGWGYGSEKTFLTKPYAPSNLQVTGRSATTISLAWTKGTAANRTMVRRKEGSYPISPSDGDQAYFGTGSSFTDSELTPNRTYYYRAWSEVSAGGYQQFSTGYAQVTGSTIIYYTQGYIEDIIDCVNPSSYNRLEWDEELPTSDEDIQFRICSSNDQVNWSDEQVIYSSPCTSFAIPVRRYFKWRAVLLSAQGYNTPKLKRMAFYWSKYV